MSSSPFKLVITGFFNGLYFVFICNRSYPAVNKTIPNIFLFEDIIDFVREFFSTYAISTNQFSNIKNLIVQSSR